jgi:hypothetical protein
VPKSSKDPLWIRQIVALPQQECYRSAPLPTTQLPLAHWADVIADPVISDAIRDRLEHAALTIDIPGESYRGVKPRNCQRETPRVRIVHFCFTVTS